MRIAFFLAFVLLALRAASAGEAKRRSAVIAFVAYAWVVSFAAGLLQRDLWPFSNWRFVSRPLGVRYSLERLIGVDAGGREEPIDVRALHPLGWVDLYAWLATVFPRLDREQQDEAAGFLLKLVDEARVRATSGGDVGRLGRSLGPLAAPHFQVAPRRWSVRAPALPLTGLRLYRDEWDIEKRHRSPDVFRRSLLYEFRRPAS